MMNSGMQKLSPFKKDPRQKLVLPVTTVSARLKKSHKPVPHVKPIGKK